MAAFEARSTGVVTLSKGKGVVVARFLIKKKPSGIDPGGFFCHGTSPDGGELLPRF